MNKFIEFELHEYMDMYPTTKMYCMSEEEASNFAEHMNKNYSGGTTSIKRVLTKEEAQEYIIDTIQDVLNRPTVKTSDGSLNSEDVDFIENLVNKYKECYK